MNSIEDIVNAVGCFTMKNLQPQFIFLPFIFPILHVSYGVGTIVGLIQIPFWQKKIKNSKATIEIRIALGYFFCSIAVTAKRPKSKSKMIF